MWGASGRFSSRSIMQFVSSASLSVMAPPIDGKDGGRSIIRRWAQYRLVIPAAVEHADDRHLVGVDGEGNYGSAPVIRDPQARANVVTARASMRNASHALAECDHCARIALRDLGRGVVGNITIELRELLFGFRCEDDAIRLHVLARVFLFMCSVASRARICLTLTARDGSALRAS